MVNSFNSEFRIICAVTLMAIHGTIPVKSKGLSMLYITAQHRGQDAKRAIATTR